MSDNYLKKSQNDSLQSEILLEEDSAAISNIEYVRQEKDYQRTINDKLKSAADWDMNLSKCFSLGKF